MSRGVIGAHVEMPPVPAEPAPVPHVKKRRIDRALGRLEQICVCAERVLNRSELDADVQGAIKNA